MDVLSDSLVMKIGAVHTEWSQVSQVLGPKVRQVIGQVKSG